MTVERLESGNIDLDKTWISVDTILDEAHALVFERAAKANVHIEIRRSGLEILADGERLKQVAINLLSNAIKFSPQGESVVAFASASDDEVEVSVQDKGRGIPPGEEKRC